MKNKLKIISKVWVLVILTACTEGEKHSEASNLPPDTVSSAHKGAKIVISDSILPSLWEEIKNPVTYDTNNFYIYETDSLFWAKVDEKLPTLNKLLEDERFLIKKKPVKNQYVPGDIDTLIEVSNLQSGDYFEFLYVKNQHNIFFLFAKIKTGEYKFPDEIKVGMSLKELLKKLDLNQKEEKIKEKGSFRIHNFTWMTSLEFLVKKDTIVEIDFHIPID